MRIDEYQRIYEAKHDAELLLLAESSAELTDEARAALQSELARRGLKAEPLAIPDLTAEEKGESLKGEVAQLHQSTNLAEFLKSVTSLYWNHFWLFIALTMPAIVIGYYLRIFAQNEGRRLATEFWSHSGESSRSALILKMSLINHATYFVTWLCFCICYVGIASAVGQIKAGKWPRAHKCFSEFCRRTGAFFRVSILLYLILLVVAGVAGLLFSILFSLLPTRLIVSPLGQILIFVFFILVAIVISRLALCIPAVALDEVPVRQSIFLSDEITRGKWGLLTALVTKSMVGGYVVGMLPFWIATWTWPQLHFQLWFLRTASIVGVVLVEPIMFIGLSLLYATAPKPSVETETAQVTT